MRNTSRRALLAGFGAASIAVPKAFPAALPPIMEAHPDADLFALIARWQAHAAACDKADEAMFAAEKRCVYPHPVETLFEREGDLELLHLSGLPYQGETTRRWYGRCHRDQLERIANRDLTANETSAYPRYVKRKHRAREIIEGLDRWKGNRAKAERACGLDVAKIESERTTAENIVLRQQIIETPARTIEGVREKARLLAWIYPGEDGVADWAHFLGDTLKDGCASDESIAAGLALDLLRLLRNGDAVRET